MDIFQIIGIGLITSILTILLKQYRPELAFSLPLICTALIIIFISPYIDNVLTMLKGIAVKTGIEEEYIKMIIKIIGISYICQFAAELCRDAGESSVASKIEFAGKIIIITISSPIINKMLDIVNSIINY